VNTKRFVGSNVNGVLTRQTCSQRSCMSAGSKRRALAFYFCLQICNMFLISKSRGASDLGLCTTSTLVLANRMPPRIGKFRHFLLPNTFINRKSPSRSGMLLVFLQVQPVVFGVSLHLNLKSQSPWSLFNRTWQKRPRKLHRRLRFENEKKTLQMQ